MRQQKKFVLKSVTKSPARRHSRLAVVGTVAVDSIKTPAGEREKCFGGSAAYFSYAASFFAPVALVGIVGRDFPAEFRRKLEGRKIDLSHLEVTDGLTFFWKGSYEGDLNNALTHETRLNALLEFNPRLRFDPMPECLFLANIDPDLQIKVLDQVRRSRVKFIACDTMNFWIAGKRGPLLKVLQRIDCMVLNDAEARQLTGESNLIKAAKAVQSMGPAIVLVKKGEHGVILLFGDRVFALPAYPVERVFDPTGAGDTFAGAMMGYLASEGSFSFDAFRRAAAFGTAVASFTVEDFSLNRLTKLCRADINRRVARFRKICAFPK